MKPLRATIIAIFSVLAAFAQGAKQAAFQVVSRPAPQVSPAFEVASVRPTDPEAVHWLHIQLLRQELGKSAAARFAARHRNGLRPPGRSKFSVVPGGWTPIATTSPAKNDAALKDLSKEQRGTEMGRRLQTLLADRFQLKVHSETREQPEYTLVIAKGGTRLKEPDSGVNEGIATERCGVMIGTWTTMSNLATVLSRQLGRSVLDRTGLSGRYDFEMSYTPDTGCGSPQSGRRHHQQRNSPRPTVHFHRDPGATGIEVRVHQRSGGGDCDR